MIFAIVCSSDHLPTPSSRSECGSAEKYNAKLNFSFKTCGIQLLYFQANYKSLLLTLSFKDNTIHYHAKNFKNLCCV